MMPSKEFMAKERMGFKIFKRVPYGSVILWGKGIFDTPYEGFTVVTPKEYGHGKAGLNGPWGRTGDKFYDVRDWFDADRPWSGNPQFKTLHGKPI